MLSDAIPELVTASDHVGAGIAYEALGRLLEDAYETVTKQSCTPDCEAES